MKGTGRWLVRLLKPAVAAIAVALLSAAPSAAIAAGTPNTHDVSPTNHVPTYIQTWVSSPQILYQCAETFCNQGQAYPGNDLHTFCMVYSAGQYWDLVYNGSNAQAGFLQSSRLTGPKSTASCSFDYNDVEWLSYNPIYQCPALFCNQGSVRPGDQLVFICGKFASGVSWDLVYNRSNGHMGFLYRSRTQGLYTC